MGFAIARAVTDEAELLSIGVIENFRRHGLTTQLLAQVFDFVASRWVEKLADEPLLLRMPLVRYENKLTVGEAQNEWKTWA